MVHLRKVSGKCKYLNLKLIVEGILCYFSNKSAFDDKLKVSCLAGVDNYSICKTNTCAFSDTMKNFTDMWCDTCVSKRRHFRSIMQFFNFILLNDLFATFFIRI